MFFFLLLLAQHFFYIHSPITHAYSDCLGTRVQRVLLLIYVYIFIFFLFVLLFFETKHKSNPCLFKMFLTLIFLLFRYLPHLWFHLSTGRSCQSLRSIILGYYCASFLQTSKWDHAFFLLSLLFIDVFCIVLSTSLQFHFLFL